MQHALNAPIKAVRPPTLDAITIIIKLLSTGSIVLFINNIFIKFNKKNNKSNKNDKNNNKNIYFIKLIL